MTNSIRDITEQSGCIFIIGSNTTEQHPVIGIKIRRAARRRGAKLIVADPRRIDIATYADMHLRHTPGTDLALLNGLMHIIIREGWQDQKFVDERTEGFEALKEVVAKYTPEVVAEITGVPAEQLERAARMMAENRPGSLLYAMGITQHTVGVANVTSLRQPADAAGQHGRAGRRGQSAARAEQRPGRVRHGRAAQLLPRLPGRHRRGRTGEVRAGVGRAAVEQDRPDGHGDAQRAGCGQRARAVCHRREPDDQRSRSEPRARGDDQVASSSCCRRSSTARPASSPM